MASDECRMTKVDNRRWEERSHFGSSDFGFRISDFGFHSSFVIRHSSLFRPWFWVAVLLLAGCRSPHPSSSQNLQRFGFSSPHMGTLFKITLYAPEEAAARSAAKAAFHRVVTLDEIMSDYQADSELMRLCEAPPGQPVRVSADLFDVLEQAQRFSALSGGAFDVTVGPFVRLWRFARKKKAVPAPAEVNAAAASVGYEKLRLDRRERTITLLSPNMRVDLGGIAKGE